MPSYRELAVQDPEYRVADAFVYGDPTALLFSYQQFFNTYAYSEHGQFQDIQPLRFSAQYDYSRNDMLAELGADTHPLGHMPATHNQLLRVLAEMSLADQADWSPADIHQVRLTALLHDIGECQHPNLGVTCGDIPFGKKTDAERNIEAQVRSALYETYFPGIPDDTLTRMERLIRHQEQSIVHDSIEAAHDASAYRTSLRAGKLALQLLDIRPNTDAHLNALTRLGKEVSQSQRQRLQTRVDTFPYIYRLLERSEIIHQKIQEL